MHVCPLSTGPVPHVGGPISGPGIPTVLLDGQVVSVVGDICVCCGPPDAVLQGAATALLDGKPVALMGSMTAHAGQIVQGIPTATIGPATPSPPIPSIASIQANALLEIEEADYTEAEITPSEMDEEPVMFTGCVDNPLMEDAGNGIEECEEVTFKSTYPLDEAIKFAQSCDEIFFIPFMMNIFGHQPEIKHYKKLYQSLKAGSFTDVEYEVVKNFGSVRYNKKTHKVEVSEYFIRRAAEDNNVRSALLTALVEEFGHHIDYQLRNIISSVGGDASGDEGAKFAYRLFLIDPLENTEQHFADATIEGAHTPLIFEFQDYHDQLIEMKEMVAEQHQHDDDDDERYEHFGAGKEDPEHGAFGHQSIEEQGFQNIGLTRKEIETIYLGNWLRDMSQLIDPSWISFVEVASHSANEGAKKGTEVYNKESEAGVWDRLMQAFSSGAEKAAGEATKATPKGIETIQVGYKKLNPAKISREAMTKVVALWAAYEFVAKPEQEKIENKEMDGRIEVEHYEEVLKAFAKHAVEIDTKVLGLYRPQEHIDNPKGLADGTGADPEFWPEIPDDHHILKLNNQYGMKNNIRRADDDPAPCEQPTAVEFMCKMLASTAQKGRNNPEGLMNFGAALHVLEDYFAHSNFVELSLIKLGYRNVIPWVNTQGVPGDFEVYFEESDEPVYRAHQRLVEEVQEEDHLGRVYKRQQRFSEGTVRTMVYAYDDKGNQTLDVEASIEQSIEALPEIVVYPYNPKYIPVVTGCFGTLDMAHSAIPKLTKALFPVEMESFRYTQPGDRSLQDAMILTLLEDFSREKSNGSGSSTICLMAEYGLKLYNIHLDVRDFKAEYGISQVQEFFTKGLFHNAMQIHTVISNFVSYFVLTGLAETVDDYQTALNMMEEEGREGYAEYALGTNPTHSQLAKDHTDHHFHGLASKMAIFAVNDMGRAMMKVWKGKMRKEEMLNAAKSYFVHPLQTDWMHNIIKKWVSEEGNKEKLEMGTKVSRKTKVIKNMLEDLEKIQTIAAYYSENYKSFDQVMQKLSVEYEDFANDISGKIENARNQAGQLKEKLEKQRDALFNK